MKAINPDSYYRRTMDTMERRMLSDALAAAKTAKGAARMLGVSPVFLHRRAKRLGISPVPPHREVEP